MTFFNVKMPVFRGIILLMLVGLGSCQPNTADNTSEKHPIEFINKVNMKWQADNPNPAENWPFWHNSAYHIGNLAAYQYTKDDEQLNYTIAWAEANEWAGAKSAESEEWKFSYGETDEHVLFGDWQA